MTKKNTYIDNYELVTYLFSLPNCELAYKIKRKHMNILIKYRFLNLNVHGGPTACTELILVEAKTLIIKKQPYIMFSK